MCYIGGSAAVVVPGTVVIPMIQIDVCTSVHDYIEHIACFYTEQMCSFSGWPAGHCFYCQDWIQLLAHIPTSSH